MNKTEDESVSKLEWDERDFHLARQLIQIGLAFER